MDFGRFTEFAVFDEEAEALGFEYEINSLSMRVLFKRPISSNKGGNFVYTESE